MSKRFLKIVVLVAGAVLQSSQQPVRAGQWSFSPGTDGGPHLFVYHDSESDYSHLSNESPPTPHPRNVPYTVTLFNPTSWTIGYSINGNGEPRLKAGETASWTIVGSRENPAVFNVSFDNGQGRQVGYKLENNKSFVFREENGGLNLHSETLATKHHIDVLASRIVGMTEDFAGFMEGQQQLPDARQVLNETRHLQDMANRVRRSQSEEQALENFNQVARGWNELSSHLRRLGATNSTHARRLQPISQIIDDMRGTFRKG
jgi:hypothetical protein